MQWCVCIQEESNLCFVDQLAFCWQTLTTYQIQERSVNLRKVVANSFLQCAGVSVTVHVSLLSYMAILFQLVRRIRT